MPRRILHVTTFVHPDKFGGAERVVHDLACAQAARGDRVVILTGDHGGDGRVDAVGHPAANGPGGRVPIIRYPVGSSISGVRFHRAISRGVCSALRALPGHAMSDGFDVVHTHQVASALPALRASRRIAPQRVFSFYAPWSAESEVERGSARADRDADPLAARPPANNSKADPWGRLRTFAHRQRDRACLRLADRVVVLSAFSLGQVAQLERSALERTTVIPAGVDVQRFRPGDQVGARARVGLQGDARWIVSVRRLTHRMGLDLLIRAVARLHDPTAERGGGALRLAIAGAGPQEAALKRLAAQSGVSARVRFLGRVEEEDLPDLYRAADLFVLPTRALEGFGMATLEAAASGTPAIGTDVGATPELLRDLCPDLPPFPATVEAIAEGIRAALARPDLARIGSRAAERVRAGYSWETCAGRIDAVYDRPGESGGGGA